ncbi:MAG TPA: Calx-beta domain-containing protein, partial [Pyrinomonadaceae bacterium]|nr:Calx-beta domain-containing protein [Pyrinomonadaceae bacterium]
NSTAGSCSGTAPVTCNIGTLTGGASATVTIIITPPAVRTITNTATATITETDALPSNNTATTQTLVDFVDVSIAKKAAQNLAAPGSLLTYSLTVKNKGALPANVTVTDNLPAGLTLTKCSATGNGVCGGSGNNVSVTFSQLAANATEVILLSVSVSGSLTEGTVINNTASVSSPIVDPDTSNNSSTASITVAAAPVLQKLNGLIGFEGARNSPVPSGIYTIKADGTDQKLLPNTNPSGERPKWSPDGSKLAFIVRNFVPITPVVELHIINANGTGLMKVASDVSSITRRPTWSPNGSQLAYIGGGFDPNSTRSVFIANADGSGSYKLPGSPTLLNEVDWSPDGTKFVYATDREIFVMNADATGQTQLTSIQQTFDGPTTDFDPSWSPDGKRILFRRSTNNGIGVSGVYVMNADGTNPRKLFNFFAGSPSWSADGLSIVFTQDNKICTVNTDNTNFKCLTTALDFRPDWQSLPNPSPTPTPTPAPTFSLSGKVTYDSPSFPGQVRLTGPVNALIRHDDDGSYEFVNLPAGQYTVEPVSIFHSFNPPSRIVTITNANITGLDFTGTFQPANITGHVRDNQGKPIVGLRIISAGGFPQGVTFTDADGFYSFPNVQRNMSYAIIPDQFTAYDIFPESQIIQNLTTSVTVDFIGAKRPSNVISGRVIEASTGQPLPGVRVDLNQGLAFIDFKFTDANGNFSFGERKSFNSFSVSILDGGGFVYGPKTQGAIQQQFAEIQIPNLTSDQNLTFTAARVNTVQFTSATAAVNEGSGSLEIAVTRTGDVASPATVGFGTFDQAALAACSVVNGKASERCDFGSTAGTLRFAAGETNKSFVIPIVNDVNVEGNETFFVLLGSAVGAQFGVTATATVTIVDNDTTPATQNPIDGVEPFVTQQYIDFLGRLPDSVGFANWVATLGGCPNGGFGENLNPSCDRVHVSSGFFLSDEFRGRGYWAYRFYEVGFDRRPLYVEFVPDMAQVGGAQSPQSELLSKAAYTDAFVQRNEFTSRYNGLSNSAYVNALEQNAEITLTNKADLIAALDANQKSRGQVLREIVESKAVEDKFFIRAFVAMQYFGYLRRDPDTIGYDNWVTTLTNDPGNIRHMIFGFLFSNEYRGRFGP